MHKLFIDINIVLDVLLEREPYAGASQRLLSFIEDGRAKGYLSALSYPAIYYIVAKGTTPKKAISCIRDVLKLLEVSASDKKTIERAIEINLKDFEDSLQAASAEASSCDYIITRNARDYKGCNIPPISPSEYLASFDK